MVDLANFRFDDTGDRFDKAYARQNALTADYARVKAGQALAGGDYQGASATLLGAGEVESGVRLQGLGQQSQDRQAKAKADREEAALKYSAEAFSHLADFHRSTVDAKNPNGDINRTLSAFDIAAKRLRELGESDEEIAQVRQHVMTDPEATFAALGAGAAKKLGYEVQQSGDEIAIISRDTGQIVSRFAGKRTVTVGDGSSLVSVPGQYSSGAPEQPWSEKPAFDANGPTDHHGAGLGGIVPSAGGGVDPDALWRSIKTQESGGLKSPGSAVGPDTPYGNALGSTQMLPATAEAMARKLGIAWNPALMRENSPKALEYQDRLGRAYLQEGLDRSGGDPAAAAAYYFGGPDEALHGPKTRAYVKQVLARAGAPAPLEGGAARDTLAPGDPSAPRVLYHQPKAEDPLKALQVQKLQGEIEEQKQKRSDLTTKAQLGASAMSDKANIVTSAVDSALGHVGRLSAGFVGGNLAEIKGTPAYNLSREIDTIKANLSFDELQKMRASSPTGGALGAVSDREIQLLGSTVASLDIGQSPDQLKANLKRIKQHYDAWKKAAEGSGGGAKLRADPQALGAAKEAVRKGADKAAVAQRLREHGIDPAGL